MLEHIGIKYINAGKKREEDVSHIGTFTNKPIQVRSFIDKDIIARAKTPLSWISVMQRQLRVTITNHQSLLDKVTVAHNKIITYMTFSKRCSRLCLWPLYCRLKVLPLDLLIKIEHAKTMYKFSKNLLPEVFDNYFERPSHQYNTRFATSQNNVEMVRITTAKEKSMLKFIGPKVWANIPIQIKNAPSLKVFINFYRNHLIGNHDISQ